MFASPPCDRVHDQSTADAVTATLTVKYKSGSEDVLSDGPTRMFVANLKCEVKPMVPVTLDRVTDCFLSDSDSDESEKKEVCVEQPGQSVLGDGVRVDSAFTGAKSLNDVLWLSERSDLEDGSAATDSSNANSADGDIEDEDETTEDEYSDGPLFEGPLSARPMCDPVHICRNLLGRHDESKRMDLMGEDEIRRTLCYQHEAGTLSATPCEGIYMTTEEQSDLRELKSRMMTIQQLRWDVGQVDEGGSIPQKLLDLLWKISMDSGLPQPEEGVGGTSLTKLHWKVGARSVCHKCWAAAAGLLTHPHMTQRTDSFRSAVKAYYHGDHVITRPKVRRRHNDATSEQRGTKRMAAKAWVQQYVSEEEGHAQQKTGDEFQHLQGMKQKQMLEKYEQWHKEESAMSGRPPSMCSKSTFNRALDDMRETHTLRPELEALHCASYVANHDGCVLQEHVLHGVKCHKHKMQQDCCQCSSLQILLDRARHAKRNKRDAQ